MADLRKRGIVTKVRNLRSGEKIGGIPFTRGPLAHLLRGPEGGTKAHYRQRLIRGRTDKAH
jgi:site-specific DNA recombinase